MINLQITSLLEKYSSNELNVREVVEYCREQMEKMPEEAFIYKLTSNELEVYIKTISSKSVEKLPLYGVPFVIKDNIDLAGVPTTAGCPDFTYTPNKSAYVVGILISAGAIPLAKTNLDQFATGLVGTRSPYGVCPNSFNAEYISGGSSSGSSVAVAQGCCSFSLGTDTAGSGRVPAAFNNLVGVKPSKGLLSCSGVVPACKSLDCVSIFALDAADAKTIFEIASDYDEADPYSRKLKSVSRLASDFKVGVPSCNQLEFFGNDEYEVAFEKSITLLKDAGATIVEIDFSSFLEAANLLYSGPWVNERYAAVGDFIEKNKEAVLSTTSSIILSGLKFSASDVFEAMYELQRLKKIADKVMDSVDLIITPTAGTYYTIKEVLENPIELNTNLGYYTNYMNLLDYAAISIPVEIETIVPFGVTVVSHAGHDMKLLRVVDILQKAAALPVGKTTYKPGMCSFGENLGCIDFAVCGAHLKGQALHHQLEELRADFVGSCMSAEEYRMYAFESGGVKKPGMIHDSEYGGSVYLEIYRLSAADFGCFVNSIPAPLGIGKIKLCNGDVVSGFIAEQEVEDIGEDITSYGDWRKYMAGK